MFHCTIFTATCLVVDACLLTKQLSSLTTIAQASKTATNERESTEEEQDNQMEWKEAMAETSTLSASLHQTLVVLQTLHDHQRTALADISQRNSLPSLCAPCVSGRTSQTPLPSGWQVFDPTRLCKTRHIRQHNMEVNRGMVVL